MPFSMLSPAGIFLCLMYFAAGVVDAVSGGGGLLILPAYLLVGFPTHYIVGTNQTSTVAGFTASLVRFAKGGCVDWKLALLAVPPAMLCGHLGARLNLLVPEQVLMWILLLLIPLLLIILLVKKDFGEEDRMDTLSRPRLASYAILIGAVVGLYQGFYAAGCGTFYLLGFAILCRMQLQRASGTSKVLLSAANLAAAITYALSGTVVWSVVLPATLFNIVGNWMGAGLAMTKGARLIRPMFLTILGLLFIKLLTGLLGLA